MQLPSSPATITFLVLAPLILWRVYSRVRRMIGRQKMSTWRARITLTMFPLLILLLALSAIMHPGLLAALVIAVAAGVALSVYGLRKTTFEVVPGALYYTPHAHLGIALSLLFLGRIVYRFFELATMRAGDAAEFARSPLTLAIFGLLAGYYVGYAFGLLRWRRGVLQAKAEREAASAPQ
jgi:cytochrome b561